VKVTGVGGNGGGCGDGGGGGGCRGTIFMSFTRQLRAEFEGRETTALSGRKLSGSINYRSINAESKQTAFRTAQYGRAHADFSNSSRPISMRRISLVPAPIS
jgi:hypothetical protein